MAGPEKPSDDAREPEADFGYRRVPRSERDGLVRDVFDSVASRYDVMNDLMSGGVHRLWRNTLMDMAAPRSGSHLLDVAGGTGDIAFRFLDRLDGDGHVTVCDITASMLDVGRDRALDRGYARGIDWVCGTAEALPFADMSVDAYTIAFGLRNVTQRGPALAEARRVLKPGGRFFCLELSRVAAPLLRAFYDRYSFKVMPLIGEIVTGDREAYRYLVESIRKFPPQDALVAEIEAAGLERVAYRNLSGGIAAIHSAWRL